MNKAPVIKGAERIALRQAMRQDYESGMTIQQVRAKHGRTYGTTWVLLHEAGTEIRPRGGTYGR